MSDMNIDTLGRISSLDKLNELCDTLSLHNLIEVSTCKMKSSSSSIDLIQIADIIPIHPYLFTTSRVYTIIERTLRQNFMLAKIQK